MKQSAVVAALALAVVVTAAVLLPGATVAAVATRPAKYTYQEDASSDFIRSVGTFSVTVYKLSHGLTMYYASTSQCWSVASGEGYEYWMVLTAKNGAGVYSRYVSIVWGIPGSESRTWKLLSFSSTD
ncbi:hypothetical protein CFC21_050921 [Triticum aestivum]|uniref:Cysteine proteinase inhibitor n=4 Tax=Triticum TaxID=4564 RepID=A0A9R0S2G9_TRITD|nr:hypothetical protein TRIUR3_03828 [Triticum urartu]KAF7041090.1 hypothetical protein CFC21_050921 [Triticum aestivum]VAH87162.1 unnamed protein product [Triticum turgidum subsp. durum]